MNKILAIALVCASVFGCVTRETPPPPMPQSGTYEYWGKVNGNDVYILWVDGKEYNEKQAKKKGFSWNPIVTTTNETITIKRVR